MAEDLTETDVVVVGGGPVGLSLAIELGLRGVRVVLVEKNERTGLQPRAKTTNVRTMQHMRRWGIADTLRDAAPLPRDYPTDIVFATRLFGRTLAVIENAFEGAKVRDPRFPEPAQWVPQYVVEAVLRDRAMTLPSVRLAFDTECLDATQNATGVVARIRDGARGTTAKIRARFLVGADGARSRIREIIGASMKGEHAFALHYNLILKIPALAEAPPSPRAIMYWVVNPESPAVMAPMDTHGRWTIGLTVSRDAPEPDDDMVRRRVREAIGRDLEFEILKRDAWAAHQLIADKYRDRCIFLAGDACHLHPPFGGYGMNLGIADSVDLGWKLAATVAGWGGPKLLSSYETERRPVHQRTIAEAVENHRTLSSHLIKANLDADSAEGDDARRACASEIVATKTREFKSLGVVLGSRYGASPIIIDDGSPPPTEHVADFKPSAHPGCLAPHAWLSDGSSLYDRFGPGFTLLRLDDKAETASRAIEAAARSAGMPLQVLDLARHDLGTLYGVALVLVRPDQFVAWRGGPEHLDADALVATVLGRKSKSEPRARRERNRKTAKPDARATDGS